MENPDSILHFWFGTQLDDAEVAQQQSKLWWSKNPEIDEEIRTRFVDLTEAAARRGLDDWSASTKGTLAHIILTDQFPRNMYRGTAKMFAWDAQALAWCLSGMERGIDKVLRPIERVFFYLPLEHSESLHHQDMSVQCYTALADNAILQARETFQGFLFFAQRHRQVIAQFGRFPHRNQALGRISTPEEVAFLKTPGSSF